VKNGALRGHLQIAPEGTSDRLDEIKKLIDCGVLRACSVGFRSIESKPRAGSSGGTVYVRSELVETSLVSVPANVNALAIARSMGISQETQRLVFSQPQRIASAGDRIQRARLSCTQERSLAAKSKALALLGPQKKTEHELRVEKARAQRARAMALIADRPPERPRDHWLGCDVRLRWRGALVTPARRWMGEPTE
jgi:hypothetical protein